MDKAHEKLFTKLYGAKPAVLASAPGRINLIGEHTDYNAGLCLPFAIRLGTEATVGVRPDGRLRVTSTEADPADTTWQEYVVGVVAELRRLGGKEWFKAPPVKQVKGQLGVLGRA